MHEPSTLLGVAIGYPVPLRSATNTPTAAVMIMPSKVKHCGKVVA